MAPIMLDQSLACRAHQGHEEAGGKVAHTDELKVERQKDERVPGRRTKNALQHRTCVLACRAKATLQCMAAGSSRQGVRSSCSGNARCSTESAALRRRQDT